MSTTRRAKPKTNRGQGYSVETIVRESGVRYRAHVWNAVAQRKDAVVNEVTGTKTFTSYAEADAAARVAKARLDGTYTEAGIPVERRRKRHTFAEYADLWVAGQGGEKNTRKTRKSAINQAKKRFEGKLLSDITEEDARAWDIASQDAGLSQGTRVSRILYLRRLFAAAQKSGLVDSNPCADIVLKKPDPEKAVRRLTEHEFQTVLQHMPEWLVPAALLGYDCGLRVGEVCGLRWERVHLDVLHPYVLVKDIKLYDGTVKPHTKTNETREVHLTPRLIEWLRRLEAARGNNEFVITGRRNKPVSTQTPTKAFQRAFVRSGLGGTVPCFHHLRHACITELSDIDLIAAQGVAGHARIETTMGYRPRIALGDQADVMAKRAARAVQERTKCPA